MSAASRHPSLWRRTPHKVEDWFDDAALESSRSYSRPLRRLRWVRVALSLVATVAVVVGDFGPKVAERFAVDNWIVQLLIVLVALELVTLVPGPWFGAYTSLVYDRRHGLSNETPSAWLKDQVKGLVIGLVVNAVLFVPLFAIIRSTDQWWIWGGLLVTVVVAALAFLGPVVLMPRFNKFTPLEDGELRSRIEAVADRAGEQIQGVFVMDASKRSQRDNAFVAGWGPTKRVVLFDTMLDHPPELIEQVVAHEIGHYRLKHIPKTVAFVAVMFTLAFVFVGWFTSWDEVLDIAGVRSIEDPAALPLLLVGIGIAFSLLGYAQAWYSRAKERQADLEAPSFRGSRRLHRRLAAHGPEEQGRPRATVVRSLDRIAPRDRRAHGLRRAVALAEPLTRPCTVAASWPTSARSCRSRCSTTVCSSAWATVRASGGRRAASSSPPPPR